MNLQAVYCFLFIMAVKWHSEASQIYENHRSLSSREINSPYRCCRGNRYNGYSNFNRRQDYSPSYNKHRYEYHTHSSIHNNYNGDSYSRPNYYDYKNPPSKYSPPKDYYPRRYNGPSHPGSKYIQNRVGFAFPDTHNVKEGNGGYRPYVPNPDFNDQRYYNKDFGYDSYRKKNGIAAQYDQQDEKRKKYKPGLLQGISIGNSGVIVATGPNGYKHVIHDLPPWAELNAIPERDNFNVRFPTNLDHRGGIEYDEPHRFSHGFNKKPSDFNNPYSMQGNPISMERNPFEEEEPPDSIKNLYGNKNGPPKDVPDITYRPHEHTPSKPKDFRPSPPFHRYSEPDPLYHPSGSPLLTHSTTKSVEIPTTKPTPRSASEISSKYPDSINAQLPPPTLNSDTRVPYVAATEVTQNAPQQFTAVTQASDATDKKPLIKVLPTEASAQNNTTETVSFITVQGTLKPDRIKAVLPTKLHIGEVTKKEENTKLDDVKTLLTKIPVLPTEIYSHNFTLDKKSSVIKKDMSKSDEIKAILSNLPVQEGSKDSFNIAIKDQKPVSPSPTLIPLVEISTRTEIFLPTIITEKYPSIQESEMKSQTEPTLKSSKETPETSDFSDTNREDNEDKIKKLLISINELSKQNSVIETTPSETTTVKTETSVVKNATNDNLMSDRTELKQTVEDSNEKTPLPILMQSTTEKMSVTTIDNLFPATRLSEEIQVKDRVSTLLDQIHNLVNHARSLDYLQYEAGTTIAPLQDSDCGIPDGDSHFSICSNDTETYGTY